MSFLNRVINAVNDEVLREELQDRVEIILHKIKFMEKVPVICLDTENSLNLSLQELLETAGGVLETDPLAARVLIYEEAERSMLELMGRVPALLQEEWPSVSYNRVYLLEDFKLDISGPEELVSALEDIAEILYPGYFVFGNEGKTWTAFGV